jgi:hypothetical protein
MKMKNVNNFLKIKISVKNNYKKIKLSAIFFFK